jgi:hypothetical protein
VHASQGCRGVPVPKAVGKSFRETFGNQPPDMIFTELGLQGSGKFRRQNASSLASTIGGQSVTIDEESKVEVVHYTATCATRA